jgi:hypothetical protein
MSTLRMDKRDGVGAIAAINSKVINIRRDHTGLGKQLSQPDDTSISQIHAFAVFAHQHGKGDSLGVDYGVESQIASRRHFQDTGNRVGRVSQVPANLGEYRLAGQGWLTQRVKDGFRPSMQRIAPVEHGDDGPGIDDVAWFSHSDPCDVKGRVAR